MRAAATARRRPRAAASPAGAAARRLLVPLLLPAALLLLARADDAGPPGGPAGWRGSRQQDQYRAMLRHVPEGSGAADYRAHLGPAPPVEAADGPAAFPPLPVAVEDDPDVLARLGQGMLAVTAMAGPPADLPPAVRAFAELGEALAEPDCAFPYFARFSGFCVRRRAVNGQAFYYHVPAARSDGRSRIKGHAILLHGAGVGRAEDWFMRINRVGLVRKLIRRGFAVSAIQSTNQWQPWGHYLDAANLDAAEDFLAAEAGGFAKGLPTVGVCVSRGCSFLHWLSKGTARDMRANYYSIPWGIDALALQTGLDALPPTLAAVGEQDRVPFSNTAVELTRFAQRMNALGKLSLVRVNREAPADECFHNLCLMPGVDAGAVQALVRELRATGVLDAEGRVAVALPTMQGRENPFESLIMDAFISVESLGAWPLVSLTGPHLDWIYQELSELQAGHRHTSDFDAEVLDYFLAAVNGRPGRVEKFERDGPAAPPAAAAEPGADADAPTALDAVLTWGALILR